MPRVIEAKYDYQDAQNQIRTLFHEQAQLHDNSKIQAMLCATDNLAIAAMDIARFEFGLCIPEDLQIIGFDNIPQTEWLSYQLSTFAQDFRRLARESVKIIVDQIQNQESGLVRLMIPTIFVERVTTLRT